MDSFLREIVKLCKEYELSYKIEPSSSNEYQPRIRVMAPSFVKKNGEEVRAIEIGGTLSLECCPIETEGLFRYMKRAVEKHFEQ